MTELGEAFVPIRATLDKLDGDLADAKSKIGGALEGLGKIGGIALGAGLAVATAAVVGLGAALTFSVGQALDAEAGQARLAQVIKSTGGAAGLTQDAANELAQEFAYLASGSDDAIIAIEEIGLRAGTIAADEMPAFIQSTLDLGAVMEDTAGAATLLARAQDDPVAAFLRIEKATGAYDSALEAQIAALVKAGDSAGAVDLIMTKLAETTGGAAAANAQTLAGRWATFQGTLGEAAESIGTAVLPLLANLFDNVIAPAIPVVEAIVAEFADGIAYLVDFATGARDIGAALEEFGPLEFIAQAFGSLIPDDLFPTLVQIDTALNTLVTTLQPIIETVVTWIAQNIALSDVLIALGVAIAAFVIPAIASVVAAAAPVILIFVGVIAVVALLRQAWESDFGGIQEKTAAVWAQVQPLLALAQEWLQVNIPIALEALRSFWVDVVWPAIQGAIEAAWPVIEFLFAALKGYITNVLIPNINILWNIWVNVVWPAIQTALASAWAFIQPILAAVGEFIVGTLIPTVLNLYTQWTTVWWPGIQTTLSNVWEVISEVFAELGRWINDNIVPWVVFLGEQWDLVVAGLQTKLSAVWAVIKPIWEALQLWLETNIPKALNALQPVFESVMTAISAAVSPVKTLWDGFVAAITSFWTWITSHTFSFEISLPDLPDWAVPGSPLPIHTAWKDFASEVGRLTIAPKFDLDALVPVMGLIGEDAGPAQSLSYNSVTHVNTNRDPLRVLRASRHLDKLGAMA